MTTTRTFCGPPSTGLKRQHAPRGKEERADGHGGTGLRNRCGSHYGRFSKATASRAPGCSVSVCTGLQGRVRRLSDCVGVCTTRLCLIVG